MINIIYDTSSRLGAQRRKFLFSRNSARSFIDIASLGFPTRTRDSNKHGTMDTLVSFPDAAISSFRIPTKDDK
jgi:hypothetical protein